jgi:hypothetical protein
MSVVMLSRLGLRGEGRELDVGAACLDAREAGRGAGGRLVLWCGGAGMTELSEWTFVGLEV